MSSIDDFIEYPHIIEPIIDWRIKDFESISDCRILLDDGTSNLKAYMVHLRVLIVSSKFFFKTASTHHASNLQTELKKSLLLEAVSVVGEIQLKLQDGRCFQIGFLSKPVSALKQQIQEFIGIPVFEQRIFIQDGASNDRELDDDWCTLSSFGVRKDDTLFLIRRQPWQFFDSNAKTITMHVPELCTRCVLLCTRA